MTYPQARFDTEGTYNPDRLIAGDRGLLRHEGGDISVPANTILTRGTLMGRQFAVRSTVADGNTATLTPSSLSVAYQARIGRYVLRVTTAGNASTQRYTLYDPDGRQLATGIQSGTANSANGHVTLTVTGSGSNAVVGDEVYFDVYASKWAKVAGKATNGTQRPAGVLVNDVENDGGATADVAGQVFTQGEFDWNVVNEQTGDSDFTLEAIGAYLREKGLVLLETREQLTDPYL